MSVYLVLAIDIKDAELYAQYAAGAGEALKPFRPRRISVDRNPKLYEGEQPANNLAIIEFESQEKLDEFFASDAYQKVIGIRHAAAETRFIMAMKAYEG